jgi:hypothetical protein
MTIAVRTPDRLQTTKWLGWILWDQGVFGESQIVKCNDSTVVMGWLKVAPRLIAKVSSPLDDKS